MNNRSDFGGTLLPLPLFCPIFFISVMHFNGIAVVYYYIRQVAALVSAEVMHCTECYLVIQGGM